MKTQDKQQEAGSGECRAPNTLLLPPCSWRFALCALPLAWLWFVLINDLRVEWTVNPQYSYGWAVPFLCAFLIWQSARREAPSGKRYAPCTLRHAPCAVLFALCALLYAPTRLVEEANPGWRLVSWALALEVVGLTLLFIRLALGAKRLAQFVFPVCFFLVAVPWPSHIEMSLIQGLTRLDTGITTELLGWLGIPAMPHGNVIEVATGMVGIDEACSGIRSFQATLMISLFLGEFYSLGASRRAVLCLSGFAFSFLFNLARMSLLVWVAAHKGINAIASWHDPAGVTILVACFFSLWGMGVLLKGKAESLKPETLKTESGSPSGKAEMLKTEKLTAETDNNSEDGGRKTEGGKQKIENRDAFQPSDLSSAKHFSVSAFQFSAFALCIWILLTEFSVEGWYRWHEARVPVAARWTVRWPVDNPTFKELPLAGTTRQILRYDEGSSAAWQETNLTWQVVFLRWNPGRTAIHLAQNHTPAVCMTAAGYTLNTISPQEWFVVNGLRMPFLAYQVTSAPQPFFVFYCLWDDRASAQGFETMFLTYGNRLAPVLAGLRNPGQRSLEISVSGPASAAEAEAALHAELEKLIISQ